MTSLARRFLGMRGVHYLATRFGWKRLRALSFDEKFLRGDWSFADENPELVALVENFAAHGHILALGCGGAAIASALDPSSFKSFLGIDLSQQAIGMARRRQTPTIKFDCGDMETHRCSRDYDVILFPNSLYYACSFSRKRLLQRLSKSLTRQGKIIVTIAQPKRYAGILDMIRKHFKVVVDRELSPSGGHVLVFSSAPVGIGKDSKISQQPF